MANSPDLPCAANNGEMPVQAHESPQPSVGKPEARRIRLVLWLLTALGASVCLVFVVAASYATGLFDEQLARPAAVGATEAAPIDNATSALAGAAPEQSEDKASLNADVATSQNEAELNALLLPGANSQAMAIAYAVADPNSSGILGTVAEDEVKYICQSLGQELVEVSKGEYLTVVSPKEPIAKSSKPANLTTVSTKEIPAQKNIELVKEAKAALISLVKHVNSHTREDGSPYKLVAVSGYRSMSYQSNLYNNKVNALMRANRKLSQAEAKKLAARVVAPPGESEHELGTAVDFTTGEQISRGGDILTNAIGATAEHSLMLKEAWRFGWVNSLMPDKERLTGRMTELWHWRYVGVPHAEIMWSNGWVPEEYRNYLRDKKSILFKSATGAIYWVRHDSATDSIIASESVPVLIGAAPAPQAETEQSALQ